VAGRSRRGLERVHEQFLGHDPAQLTPHLKGLSIDRQGRIYSCDMCKFTSNLLACDGADRIKVGDVDHAAVRSLDTAGNLIQRVGTCGNAQTLPSDGANAKESGFSYIGNIAASGARLFVVDRVLHRVAGVRVDYREAKLSDAAQAFQEKAHARGTGAEER
jgi:hypothetical protein